MSEILNLSDEDKILGEFLLDRDNTIKQIDTVFDPNNDSFSHIDKIGKDAKTYLKTLSIPLLRIALARITDKNPTILMSLMNNFSENFPGGIYRREPYYNPKTAASPRQNRSDIHSTYFREHTPDDLFVSIDQSMQTYNIDPQTILDVRVEIKNSRVLTQSELLRHIHQVFVDLLEEGYSRDDLRA